MKTVKETRTIYDLTRKHPKTGKPGYPETMPAKRAAICLRYNSQQWVTKSDLTAVAVQTGAISAEVVEAVQDVSPADLKEALALLKASKEPKQEPKQKRTYTRKKKTEA